MKANHRSTNKHKRTMHFHPRVLLLLAAATLSTACSLPICEPGCNVTYTDYPDHASYTYDCEGPSLVRVPVDTCMPRVTNISVEGDVCGNPSLGGGYDATLECLAQGTCWYEVELLRSVAQCTCPTNTSCSIEEKCAAQQAEQVTQCTPGSYCFDVTVCGETGYCQAVAVKGNGTCATKPCSNSHDCTQDTPSNYTCAPKPMACCAAMPTCGAGLNTSMTPCTADEVSSGTCSRSAMCCSEVFCRTASCSIEEKCAAQQAKQVTQCAPGSYCFDVTVCGETAYCAAVAVKGNGTCATKPCSNSHDCTQDTPSNYTCAPKPMACCAAMPTCGAGLNTSMTPCTADEVSSGTCSRSAMCCSEVFCRNSCSIEAKCAAQQSKQVTECPQDASCLTVSVCGVVGYCMATSVDPLTPSPCSIEAKCASQQAEQVTVCPAGSYCAKVEVCDVTGYCQAVAVEGNGTCATKPCSNSHDCTQDTPSNYTCAPKPMACCAAMPTCGAGLNTSMTPCTADEVLSGTCSRSAMCCSEVFCRTASCSIEEKCAAQQAKQVTECPADASCLTVSVCGVVGYCMATSVDPLTPSPCSIEAKCASQQAEQVTKCPAGSYCAKVEVCDVTGYCQAVAVEGNGTCATKPCSNSHDCTQDTPSNYKCTPKPVVPCCEAAATCASGEDTSNTPCTEEEVSSGTCSRNAICCSEVFCRTASCSIEAKCAAQQAKQVTECPADASCLTVSVCGVKGYCMYTTVPTPSTCSIAAKCAAAHAEEVSECPQDASCLEVEACGVKGYCMDVTYEGEGTCATKPCSGSRICSQESSSTYSCAPEPFACCEAAAVCDSGYKASMQTPCTADEVSSGTCSRSAICCSEVFCRKGGSGDDDHVPAYAWVLIALGSALLVVVVVSAVCLYRRMSPRAATPTFGKTDSDYVGHSEQMIVTCE